MKLSSNDPSPHQFRLLAQRRYAPFFVAVFLGGVNDNLLKFAITLLMTYHVTVPGLSQEMVGPVLGALFILPSLLWSASAGQWADRCDLAALIRLGKGLEVLMMGLAAFALWQRQVPLLMLSVFLSGLHVTLFSTVKYAYLPQHLDDHELTGGNGVLEMGTFVAILLGSIVGGALIGAQPDAPVAVGWTVLALAATGWLAARTIPQTPAVAPGLRINWNPLTETWRNLRRCHEDRQVLLALLGISWMWFFGAGFLTVFPVLSKHVLHAGEGVASLLLLITSVGVAVGALMCERLSRGRIELGLVPLGALGMGWFAVDLAWATHDLGMSMFLPRQPWGVRDFVENSRHWRFMADLGLMACSIGLFSVPLYALMQARAEHTHRARIIASNNILNALFILVSAGAVAGLMALGLSMGQVFLTFAMAHVVLCSSLLVWYPSLGRSALGLLQWRR